MKIIRKIIEFLLGTSIIWIPIVGSIIAEKLSQIITMEQIMTVVYISIPILFIAIIKMEIDEAKEERRKSRIKDSKKKICKYKINYMIVTYGTL